MKKIKKETPKINVKMPHEKKPLAQKKNLIQAIQLGLERTMNRLGKPRRKKILSKK